MINDMSNKIEEKINSIETKLIRFTETMTTGIANLQNSIDKIKNNKVHKPDNYIGNALLCFESSEMYDDLLDDGSTNSIIVNVKCHCRDSDFKSVFPELYQKIEEAVELHVMGFVDTSRCIFILNPNELLMSSVNVEVSVYIENNDVVEAVVDKNNLRSIK
jgi:hypothetical protein